MRVLWGGGVFATVAREQLRHRCVALDLSLATSPPPPPDTSSTIRCCCLRLQLLELDVPLEQGAKYSAVDKWAAQLQSLHSQVVAKLVVA